ncbi:retrotransposable element protein, partial [Planoprotostelium fungivorum]
EAHPGSSSYILSLPPSIKIYPVFHTSLLTPYVENTLVGQKRPAPPPVIIDGEQEYEVEAILDVRKRYGKTQYLVSWKGYGPEENLWLPEDNLSNSPDLVADFKARTARPNVAYKPCLLATTPSLTDLGLCLTVGTTYPKRSTPWIILLRIEFTPFHQDLPGQKRPAPPPVIIDSEQEYKCHNSSALKFSDIVLMTFWGKLSRQDRDKS